MMKKNILTHFKYYLTFALMQLTGFFLLLSLSNNKNLQIAVIFMTTIIYVSWALAHQYIHHSLSKKIVLEYILFGIFGLTVTLYFFK
jgi:hypothetical protein